MSIAFPHSTAGKALGRKRGRIATVFFTMFALVASMAWAPPTEALGDTEDPIDLDFTGAFSGNNYQPTSEEELAGSAERRSGDESIVDSALSLAGTNTGMVARMTSSTFFTDSGDDIDKNVRAEMIFTPKASQPALATLFSAGGNLFVRYENDKLVWGFASYDGSKWANHKQSMDIPSADQAHLLRMEYLPGDTTEMKVSVDGVDGPVISVPAKSRLNGAAKQLIGIGAEVNPDGDSPQRGFNGAIDRVRVLAPDAPFELTLTPAQDPDPTPIAPDALDVSFGGAFSDGNAYTAATGEKKDGPLERLAGSEEQIAFGGLRLTGGDTGVKFTATNEAYNLREGSSQNMTKGFRAEVLYVPEASQVALGTVFSVGANLSVRYQNDKLRYGFDSYNGSSWSGHYKTMDLPAANKSALIRIEYLPSDSGQTTMRVSVNGEAGEAIIVNATSHMADNLTNVYGFGTEVHPAGTGRGLKGVLKRVRLGAPNSEWVIDIPADSGNIYDEDCDFDPITPAHTIPLTDTDCAASIRAKLSAVRPTPAQANFLDAGLTAFIHYGINTYWGADGREWGWGDEDPMIFNPTNLDTDQWAKTLADAGFRYAILTVKHHDGFTLYPSRYNEFGVQSSLNFAGGKGDVVREFANSARKFGLKVGFYVSPADGHQERLGIYGNGKPKVDRSIPTLVANDDRTGKIGSADFPGPYNYVASDYGSLFLNTLYELLTEYGPIDEVWFDGAAGNTSQTEVFDHTAYFDLIRKLQPNALIAVAGPDVRWVGNEGGLARNAEWSPQGVFDTHTGNHKVMGETSANLGSFEQVVSDATWGRISKLTWYPAEADVSLRPGWFYHNAQSPKNLGQLQKIYNESYGRNAVLLLNVPPNREGKFAEQDVARLKEWTQWREDAYGANAALGKSGSVTYPAADPADADQTITTLALGDGSNETAAPNPNGSEVGTWQIDLGEVRNIDAVTVTEATREHGQQVEAFTLEVRNNDSWTEVASAPVIGARRILPLGQSYPADAVRIKVSKARGPVFISEIQVHAAGEPLVKPSVIYVDPSAEISGDGSTADTPLGSIDQLKEMTFAPGTTILFKRGTTITGNLILWGYGTEAEPITIGYYGEGADPVLNLDNTSATTMPEALDDLRRSDANWVMQSEEPEPAPEPTLTIANSAGVAISEATQGDTIRLVATDFLPGEDVTFTLHSDPVVLGTVKADADSGAITHDVQLPDDVTAGDHQVTAVGATSGREASTPLKIIAKQGPEPVEKPSITINDNEGTPLGGATQGDQVTVTGENFTPGEKLILALGSGEALGEVTVGADGSFSAVVTIPEDSSVGLNSVMAKRQNANPPQVGFALFIYEKSDPQPAEVTVRVINPVDGEEAHEVPRSALVGVGAKGFNPGEMVTLTLDDGTVLGQSKADADGKISTDVTIPSEASLGETHITAANDDASKSASWRLVIVDPAGVDPDQPQPGEVELHILSPIDGSDVKDVPRGAQVRVVAAGFAAGETVTVTLADGTVLGQFTADGNGEVNKLVIIPAGTDLGENQVTAANADASKSDTRRIVIVAAPSVDPDEPGTPTDPDKPGTPTDPDKPGQPSKPAPGMPSTGAQTSGLILATLALLGAGSALVARRRESSQS